MVERQLPKLHTGVRFPSPALLIGDTSDFHTDLHDYYSKAAEALRGDAYAASIFPNPTKAIAGVDLISNALPFARLWYTGPEAVANAIAGGSAVGGRRVDREVAWFLLYGPKFTVTVLEHVWVPSSHT